MGLIDMLKPARWLSAGGAGARARRLVPIRFGSLRRTTPLSGDWGFDRGLPVDRYYIEAFLERNRADIRGRVLEVKDSAYTDRFGGSVVQRDVLDILPTNPHATIVADLARADAVPSNAFDCFILTQTLQLIYDVPAAIGHAHRILRSGGVLLVSVPSVSRIVPERDAVADYWRFTRASCTRLFGAIFGEAQIQVLSHGNVLPAVAFLMGLASEELRPRELDAHDPDFPLVITVRAVKGQAS